MSDDEFSGLSAGDLRSKLEQALKRNRELEADVAAFNASRVISDKGFSLVKPEDLAGVPVAELEAKAAAIQAQRQDEQRGLLKDVLQKRGYEGDDLESALTALLGDSKPESQTTVPPGVDVARSVAGVESVAPPGEKPASDLHDLDALTAYFEKQSKQPKRLI